MEILEGVEGGKILVRMQCIKEEYMYKKTHIMMRKEGQALLHPVVPLEKYFFLKKRLNN